MTETVGAAKGERTSERLGYRAGYYDRTLVTRVGKLELRVPQDQPVGTIDGHLLPPVAEERLMVVAVGRPYEPPAG